MKKLLLALMIFCSNAHAEAVAYNVIGFDDFSCGAWFHNNSDHARRQYVDWFRGVATGYNFGRPNNQIPMANFPNQEALIIYIDNYCKANPLGNLVQVAMSVIKETRAKKAKDL